MQTGPIIMCAGGMLQHDKQATSRCLCAAPHSAFRIPLRTPHSFPEQASTCAAARSKQTDGWPWIERLGNAECGMRNVVCR